MTVHKSQGSEFDQIDLVLPPYPIPLLSKELMYTAITRSRYAVTFVGNGSMLSTTLLEHSPRSSGLSSQIQKAHQPHYSHIGIPKMHWSIYC